jgi:hypothetical protein
MSSRSPRFPVKVSGNKRYFVDQDGVPVFWLGTTQWELFRGYSLKDATEIIKGSRKAGFTFIQTKLLGAGDGTIANVAGEKPFINDDPLTPNEAYFRNVDAVVEEAGTQAMIISFSIFHMSYRKIFPLEKMRRYARWFAARYAEAPHIFWNMTPEATEEYVPLVRELAAGIRDADHGRHLITFKPDPAPFSSSFMHGEEWLDFDSIQTWKDVQLIHPMVTKDYAMLPPKPVLMAEGAYEAGTEYGFEVSPLWVRRQAYYSYLLGAHHGYGHNDSWRILPTWKKSLAAPAARQMGIMRRVFETVREWWLLVPDQSVLEVGGKTDGTILTLAARHERGEWGMVYFAEPSSCSVRMEKLSPPKIRARWVDPRTGKSRDAGRGDRIGVRSFTTPTGWEDALLILERA